MAYRTERPAGTMAVMSRDAEFQPPVPGMTIRCREVVELITDYLDDALDQATRTEFEAHLALCEPCVTYLQQMQATLRAVGSIPLESLSESTKSHLITAFRDMTDRS
jgi:anti-sigma factor RsiW